MNEATFIAVPHSGQTTLWRLADPEPASPAKRAWHGVGIALAGIVVTGGAATAAWMALSPAAIVQTRIVADGHAGRAVLSDMALRLAGAPDRPALLQDGGTVLIVTVKDRDAAVVDQRSRSLVDAILDAPVPAASNPAAPVVAGPGARLLAERSRITAAIEAVDARQAAASNSLTALARDMAASTRAAEQRPGRDTLDKANAALADLQLQRLQLASKYQDTYPAVIALDGQIRNLHVFLSDEAQRIQARPATAEPGNSLLAGERDRLHVELSQLDERRRALRAQLSEIDRSLARAPADAAAAVVPAAAAPVLVAAATSHFDATDVRPVAVALVLAIGAALSWFACSLAGRRHGDRPLRGMVLHPAPQGVLAAGDLRMLAGSAMASLTEAGRNRVRGGPAEL